MKIGLQTWGTDGDIRPFLALAGGLRARGHEVTLVVTNVENKDFSLYGRQMDYRVVHAGRLSYDEAKFRRVMQKLITAPHFLFQFDTLLTHTFVPIIPDMYAASELLCKDNDIIIGHFIHYPARAAAEKAGKPYITVALNHGMVYSRHTRVHGSLDAGKWLYPFSWKVASFCIDLTMGRYVNRFRKQVGLPAARNIMSTVITSDLLNLICESAAISVRQPDWPDYQQVCGVFSVPDAAEEWSMPAALKQFLASGPPPVFMTLGSMLNLETKPAAITTLLVQAALLAGCRAIVQSRWDKITNIPDHPDIYKIGAVPHQHVFPSCSAVVHHGGSGTTHSSTLHGCPSIVLEHFLDQQFFGNTLKEMGVAPPVLHRKNVTAKKLASAIRTVLDSTDMKRRAEELGAFMRTENGVKRAVDLIEGHFSYARQ